VAVDVTWTAWFDPVYVYGALPALLVQVRVTGLGVAARAVPEFVTIRLRFTTRAVPVVGVNVTVPVVVPTVMPLHPGVALKTKFVGVGFAPTDAEPGSATRPVSVLESVGVTLPLLTDTEARAIVTGGAPMSVSQVRLSAVGLDVSVAVAACKVPVQMTSARIARSTLRKRA
jgi:hypothetical protein